MKIRSLVFAAAASIALATPAFAQDVYISNQDVAQYLAKDILIGAKVRGDDGKIIGDIEDLIINQTNTVEGVIMGTGGFLGVAEKKVAVKLSALDISTDDAGKTIVSLPGATQDSLKEVAAFERAAPKKSLLERAQEKAKELTDKTTKTTSDTYEKVKENTAPTLEKAKDAVGSAYEKTKEAAGTAYEKAKEAAKPAVTPAEAPVETPAQ